MEQHPIPQAITTYEFRLVGEMTLKQFVKLAAGLGLAFLCYISPLPFYLKWPLVLIFVFLGVALAFIPIEGRPLEIWIVSFLKAIYSPTEFVYQKQPELPEFLQGPMATSPAIATPVKPITAPSQAKLKEYLGTLPVQEKITAWEQAEKQFFSQVKTAFEKVPTPRTVAPTLTQKAPPLLTPQNPNIVSGIVKDQENKFVDQALVEIRDKQGLPLRTLKTNSLGQFKISLPLENGVYEIEVEKEGLKFDIIKIKLEGKIVAPLEIKAK